MAGGVCAVLDYEIEQMAEYVSEMAVRVVTPQASVTPSFRRFVSRVLSSTRLPSTTILLGMNYLAKRINLIHTQGAFNAEEGQVWRMFTIALLLSSKFLDDNTFQNRSWSEVTGIPVAELNFLEHEWLEMCCWDLYVNLNHSQDYRAWLASWDEWMARQRRLEIEQARAAEARAAEARATEQVRIQKLAALPSLQTAFGDHYGIMPSPCATAHSVQSLVYGGNVQDFSAKRLSTSYAVGNSYWGNLTPPDSGSATPAYMQSVATVNNSYNDWFSRAIRHENANANNAAVNVSANAYQSSQKNYYHQRPVSYVDTFPYSPWNPSDYGCSPFEHPKQSYFAPHHGSYGQPVMG